MYEGGAMSYTKPSDLKMVDWRYNLCLKVTNPQIFKVLLFPKVKKILLNRIESFESKIVCTILQRFANEKPTFTIIRCPDLMKNSHTPGGDED